MAGAVKVVDRGARRVLRNVRRSASRSVDVGIIGTKAGSAHQGSAQVTVAQVAEWAEFGLGQPQRSWLRAWVDANLDRINEQIDAEVGRVVAGEADPEQVLQRLGLWLVGEMQANISNFPENGFEPNAPSTIAQKGSDTPLIDKGQLRSSITSRVTPTRSGPPALGS